MLMTVLRAYVDDSGKENDSYSMVLAGYIASVETWEMFSIDWKKILESYGLKNFHMVEAWRLGRSYRKLGPIRRNALLTALVECISDHVEHAFVLSMDTESYRHWYGRKEFPDIDATRPYLLGFHGMLTMISDYVYNRRDDCDFTIVYDEQGGESAARVLDAVQTLRDVAKQHGRDTMRIPTPQFMSDDSVPPLQAADLLAWLCRRKNHNYRDGKEWQNTAERHLLDGALSMPSTIKLFGDKELEAMSKDAARRLRGLLDEGNCGKS